MQHERDRDDNAHQTGERNHVRREPRRINGPGQRGPEFIEEEALEERERRALVLVLFYGTLAGDGAAEEPGDEEHACCARWRLVAAAALDQQIASSRAA